MRIAYVSATFPPYQAGTGNVCYLNARELAKLNHNVDVYTAAQAGAPTPEEMAGFTVYRLQPWMRIGNAPLLPQLLWRLKGYDIVHLHYPFIFGDYLTRLTAAVQRTPCVVTFHNDLIGDGARSFLFERYQALSAHLLLRSAAALCVVSTDHFITSRLYRTLGKHHPSIFEIPNGVDCDHFRPDGETDVRERYRIPLEAQLVLFVAALDRAHHFKGLDLLIQAFAALHENCWLLIVGDGDMRKQYETHAAEAGLSEHIVFAGSVDNAALPPYYRSANLTVLPSSPPESFGLVLIESLACGTAVIASDIPGVGTVVGDRIDGFLVKPNLVDGLATKLTEFLQLPDIVQKRMGQAGREKVVAQYSATSVAQKLQEVYEQINQRERA